MLKKFLSTLAIAAFSFMSLQATDAPSKSGEVQEEVVQGEKIVTTTTPEEIEPEKAGVLFCDANEKNCTSPSEAIEETNATLKIACNNEEQPIETVETTQKTLLACNKCG